MPAAEIVVHPNQEVRVTTPFGFPLREDVTGTDTQGGALPEGDRRSRAALKLIEEPLRKILEPHEAVLFIAYAQIMPGKAERYLLGVQSHSLAPAALVLTNRRLLHLAVQWNGRWNRGVRSVLWGDVVTGKSGGIVRPQLHIEYRDGSRETYWRLRRDAAMKIELLLGVLLPAAAGETAGAGAISSLCPDCLSPLTPRLYACGHCRRKFKNEKSALIHALFIPGGGHFYAGYNLWGVAHAFVDASILATAFLWTLAALGRVPPPTTVKAHFGGAALAAVAVVMAALLIIDVWLSIRVALQAVRNFIPES